MTAKTMAEVIINHPWLPDHEGLYTGLCPSCPGVKIHGGHNSPSHAAHIAEALSAAGFGLVADAKAEAWDEGWAARAWRDPVYRVPDTNPYRSTS